MDRIAQIRQLMDERKSLVTQLETLNKRDLTPDEQSMFDDLTAKVGELDQRVSTLEEAVAADPKQDQDAINAAMTADQQDDSPQQNSKKLDNLETRLADLVTKLEKAGTGRRSGPAIITDYNDRQEKRDKENALRGWALHAAGKTTDAHRAAAKRLNWNIDSRSLDVKLFGTAPKNRKEASARAAEERAQAVGTGSSGGYLVPITLSENLEKTLLYYAPVRQVAQVIRTGTGNQYDLPVVTDTSNKGEIISENTQYNPQDVSFSKVSLQSFKYSSKLVLASIELLQDSVIDIPALLGDLLGERLGRIQADHFTTGTGTGQPQGMVTGAQAGVTAASATAITVDDLLQTLHSVDRAYRDNASWMMSDQLLLAIRRLKDTLGRPIFAESYIEGEPNRILGYPVFINNSMTGTIASGNKTVVFGQLDKYVVRDALDIQVIRLDERYADYGQVGFVALQRCDGRVLQPNAIKYLVH